MNDQEIHNLIAFSTLLFTVFSGLIAFIFWYVQSEKRQYGLERDCAHLRRNYEQLAQGMDLMLSEIDRRFDSLENNIDSLEKELLEIKSIINLKLEK